MRIPMRDKQPNRTKSLRLKISFYVLQFILGNKNRVIRRKILLFHHSMHALTHAIKFSVAEPVRSASVCPCPQTVSKSTLVSSL